MASPWLVTDAVSIFELNPDLDVPKLAQQFADNTRVQIRDILTQETAERIRSVLAHQTKWGMAWQAGDAGESEGPQAMRAEEIAAADGSGKQRMQQMLQQTHVAAQQGQYAFRFARYPMQDSYIGKWDEGSAHDAIFEYLNAPEFLDLMREVTGIPELLKAGAQATLYGPQNFLANHADTHVEEGWRVAYIMNFAPDEWSPNWGGHLLFYDDDGDIIEGWLPRFNTLNLFAVPQAHAVSFVPPFAPVGRYAIGGWLRDR